MRSIFFLLILSSFYAFAQKKTVLADSLGTNMPREKLYVHFDRSNYAPNDTLWFKAYLIDASSHTASALSGLIYTELIDELTGQVVESKSLPTALGLTWGSFALSSMKYKPGTYTFRAYTNWMQNFGEAHFFKREIKILSLSAETSNATAKQYVQDIDIQFLPEGGRWIVGMPQRIAFKAIDANGKGVAVQGEIVDAKQQKIVDLQSNALGMGYINILPSAGENYSAVLRLRNAERIKIVDLPRPQQNGTILQVSNNYNRDSVKITAYSSEVSDKEITIIGQSRGVINFTSKIRFNTNIKFIYIPKNTFLTGVNQILMKDGDKILNERNFFINRKEQLKLALNTDKISYGIRDSIPIQLNVLDAKGKPVEGSFSIAITDDGQVAKDSINDANILSYFLLTSDLKGEIEKPGYYFHQPDEQKHNDLDALMLTQGWVSYDWDFNKKPLFKMEKEYAVSGRVYGLLQRPIPNAKMTMLGKNRGVIMINTVANEKGEFTFNDLPLMDSASFVIQAKNMKDKAGALTIEVDEFKRPLIPIIKKKSILAFNTLDSISKNFITTKNQEAKMTFKEGIVLNEVNIIGKRVIKGSKNLNGPGEADQTITEEELNKVSKKTLLDLMFEKVKGFNLRNSSPRGIFINSDSLKLIIDGLEVDHFYENNPERGNHYYNYIKTFLDNYQAEDIKGIEVMSSMGNRVRYVSEYIESRSGNKWAFVEITTKLGLGPFVKKTPNLYLYKPMNYGDTKTFYSPRYTSANKLDKKPDFRSTLYWNPNIVTDEKGNAQTSFFSSDKKGSYTVWVEGSDLQGNFGFATYKIFIK